MMWYYSLNTVKIDFHPQLNDVCCQIYDYSLNFNLLAKRPKFAKISQYHLCGKFFQRKSHIYQ